MPHDVGGTPSGRTTPRRRPTPKRLNFDTPIVPRVKRVTRPKRTPLPRPPPMILTRLQKIAGARIAKVGRSYVQRQTVKKLVKGIGEAKQYMADKKSTGAPGSQNLYTSRTPYVTNLTAISKATGAHEIDKRLRHSINITGFSVDVIMRSIHSKWMLLNFAVVSPKNNNWTPPSFADFFRDYTTSTDVSFSTALSGNEMHTLPINTDKWNVLAHKREQLGRNEYYTGVNTTLIRRWWMPLNRSITFNDDEDTAAECKVWFIFWCTDATGGHGQAEEPDVILGSIRTVTYFNELTQKPKRFMIL